MKTRAALACRLLLISLTMLSACGSRGAVVGRWVLDQEALKGTPLEQAAAFMQVTAVFHEDGTYETTMHMALVPGSQPTVGQGTWTVDGKTVTITPTHQDGEPVLDQPRTARLEGDRMHLEDLEDEGPSLVLVKE